MVIRTKNDNILNGMRTSAFGRNNMTNIIGSFIPSTNCTKIFKKISNPFSKGIYMLVFLPAGMIFSGNSRASNFLPAFVTAIKAWILFLFTGIEREFFSANDTITILPFFTHLTLRKNFWMRSVIGKLTEIITERTIFKIGWIFKWDSFVTMFAIFRMNYLFHTNHYIRKTW